MARGVAVASVLLVVMFMQVHVPACIPTFALL
jgi:hypothetical protein